jgi:hypothetical protein
MKKELASVDNLKKSMVMLHFEDSDYGEPDLKKELLNNLRKSIKIRINEVFKSSLTDSDKKFIIELSKDLKDLKFKRALDKL